MTAIVVNVVDLGAAANVGAVRYNLPDGSVILIHETLTVDEQAELLAEFTRPGEQPVYVQIPEQRRQATREAGLRVAAAAALASMTAACGVPGVTG